MDVSYGNTISENLITDSYNGIQLHEFSNLNTIVRNTLIHNECGVDIQASSSNRFFHNNFIENTQQVLTLTWDANFWDDGYPNGGNYWSDYKGLDLNGDKIGDTPYEKNGVIDYLPIWQTPVDILTPENKTYTEPTSGYYPGTFGFENDIICSKYY